MGNGALFPATKWRDGARRAWRAWGDDVIHGARTAVLGIPVGAVAFSPAGDKARGFVFTGCIAALIQIIFLSANHPVAADMPEGYAMLAALYAVGAFLAYAVTLWTSGPWIGTVMVLFTFAITAIGTRIKNPVFASAVLANSAGIFFGNYQRPSTSFDKALATFVGAMCGLTLTYLSLLLVFQKTASERALLRYERHVAKQAAVFREAMQCMADGEAAAVAQTSEGVDSDRRRAAAARLSTRVTDSLYKASGAMEAVRQDAVKSRGEQRLRWLPVISARFRVYLPVLRLPRPLGGGALLGLAGGDARLHAALAALHEAGVRQMLTMTYIGAVCGFERGAFARAATCEGSAGLETLGELREAIAGGIAACSEAMHGMVHRRRTDQAERAIEQLRASVARGERALLARAGRARDGGANGDGAVVLDVADAAHGESAGERTCAGSEEQAAEQAEGLDGGGDDDNDDDDDSDELVERQLLWSTACVALEHQLKLQSLFADALVDLREWDLRAAPPPTTGEARRGATDGGEAPHAGGGGSDASDGTDEKALEEEASQPPPPLMERAAAAMRGLAHEWASPFRRGFRTAAATVVPVAVGFSHVDDANVFSGCQTAVITIAILHWMQTVGTLVNKSVARVIGTLCAGFFAYGVLQRRNDVWFVWWQTFWIFLCLTLGGHMPNFYAGIVAAFTFAVIGYGPESTPTASIFTTALTRVVGVLSGIGIMAIFVLLFFQETSSAPAWSALRSATQRVAAAVRQAASGARAESRHRGTGEHQAQPIDASEASAALGDVKACAGAAAMGAMERLLWRKEARTFYVTHVPLHAYLSHIPLVGRVDPSLHGRVRYDGLLPSAEIEAVLRSFLRALDAAAVLAALDARAADAAAGAAERRDEASAHVHEALDAIVGEVARVSTVGGCAASGGRLGQVHTLLVREAQIKAATALAEPARSKAMAAIAAARQSLEAAEREAVRFAADASAAGPCESADVARARVWGWRMLLRALERAADAMAALARATP